MAPKYLMDEFYEKLMITPSDVMESVYNRPFPNRFLAVISYFLADYMDDEYVYNLLVQNLRSFFSRNVCQYDYRDYPLRFVGSVAHSYSKVLKEIALEYYANLDMIRETPMDGLIEYHAINNIG